MDPVQKLGLDTKRQFEWRPNDTSIPAPVTGYTSLFPREHQTLAPAVNHPTAQKPFAWADDMAKGSLSNLAHSRGVVSAWRITHTLGATSQHRRLLHDLNPQDLGACCLWSGMAAALQEQLGCYALLIKIFRRNNPSLPECTQHPLAASRFWLLCSIVPHWESWQKFLQ